MLGNVPSTTTGAFDYTNPNCLKYVPDGTDVSAFPHNLEELHRGRQGNGRHRAAG